MAPAPSLEQGFQNFSAPKLAIFLAPTPARFDLNFAGSSPN